jgi:hypothetical protein
MQRCDLINGSDGLVWPTLIVALFACSSVFAENASNLKGLSIEVNWTTVTTFSRDGAIKTTLPENREWQGYIGTGNHIFEKTDFANTSQQRHFGGTSVSEFGKARKIANGGMAASTIINDKLTIITKLIHGFNVLSISLSPSRGSCTLSAKLMPDETGKIQIIDPYTNLPTELISRTVQSYTCIVKQGNIFAE